MLGQQLRRPVAAAQLQQRLHSERTGAESAGSSLLEQIQHKKEVIKNLT